MLRVDKRQDIEFLKFKALYMILGCRLRGIGCNANSNTTFEALFEISQLKNFRAAKAAAILLYLRDALGVSITDSSITHKVFSRYWFSLIHPTFGNQTFGESLIAKSEGVLSSKAEGRFPIT